MNKKANRDKTSIQLIFPDKANRPALQDCDGYRLVLHCTQSKKKTGSTAHAVPNRREPIKH